MDRASETSLMVLGMMVCFSSVIWIPALLGWLVSIGGKKHDEFMAEIAEADRVLNADYKEAINVLARSKAENEARAKEKAEAVELLKASAKEKLIADGLIAEFWRNYGEK